MNQSQSTKRERLGEPTIFELKTYLQELVLRQFSQSEWGSRLYTTYTADFTRWQLSLFYGGVTIPVTDILSATANDAPALCQQAGFNLYMHFTPNINQYIGGSLCFPNGYTTTTGRKVKNPELIDKVIMWQCCLILRGDDYYHYQTIPFDQLAGDDDYADWYLD